MAARARIINDRNGHNESRLTSRWPSKAAAPSNEEPPSIPITGRVLAVFDDYRGLRHALRDRTDEMGFTREDLDHLSGNQPGYSGKLLGRAQIKKFGKQSLGNVLGAVGTYLALVEDPEQIAKLKAVAAVLSALSAVAALGITRAEFERIANLAMPPVKNGIGDIGA